MQSGDKTSESYFYLAPSPVTGLRRPVEVEQLNSGKRYWYQSDGLDSTVALTDESGKLVAPMLYDEYGQPLAGTADLARFTYTAQDYDVETGLLHFYARYYDAKRGVWLGEDSFPTNLFDPLSLNRYAFVTNNPTNAIDLLGYWGWNPIKAIGDFVDTHKEGIVKAAAITGAVALATVATVATVATFGAATPLAVAAGAIAAGTIAGAVGAGVGTVVANNALGRKWNDDLGENTAIGATIGLGIGSAAATVPTLLTASYYGASFVVGTGVFWGASACTLNPFFSDSASQACGIAQLVGSGVQEGSFYAIDNESKACNSSIDNSGRKPINSSYAGKTYYLNDPQLQAKYPNGVRFTNAGYPDFSPYAKVSVKINMQGNRTTDFDAANAAAGFTETPAGYTWHHNEDLTTMQLIPSDLHYAVRHTGGVSILKNSGE